MTTALDSKAMHETQESWYDDDETFHVSPFFDTLPLVALEVPTKKKFEAILESFTSSSKQWGKFSNESKKEKLL
ncbi:CLUMA_CG007455, isoform A [Clunio marinus]|uniref:CLUMA_CG007455, isoform A n=1 Tax=Clunio marinus TaxID=568069 RepID=A0A1J1I0R8_9DIPT|nr:CLUMA_CG007455, isoform A [Clunio marinus]